jgi:tetratricopeptide (TPR) repeat protein
MVYYFLKDYDFFISLIFGSICGYIGELFVTKRVKSFFQYPELKKHFFLIFPIMGIILVLLIYNQHIKNRVSAIERYKRLALEESVKKNYDKAIEYYKKALSETRKVLPENEYKYYRELGFVYYFHKNDYDNAIYYFEKAVKNWQYNHGTCRLDECYLWLGYAYHKKGKKKEAIKNLEMVEKVSISPIFKRRASREIQRILGIKKECPKMKEDISKMKKEIPKKSPEVKKHTPGIYPLILVPEKKNNKSEVK